MRIPDNKVSLNGTGKWVAPERARIPGLTHEFTTDGEYVRSVWTVTGKPFEPGCAACALSGICGCVIRGVKFY